MKIRPVRAEFSKRKTIGQTDGHDEANSRFSQFSVSLKLGFQRDKTILHNDIWRIVKASD